MCIMSRLLAALMIYMIVAGIDSAQDDLHFQIGFLGYHDSLQPENACFSYCNPPSGEMRYAYGNDDDEPVDYLNVEELKRQGYPQELLDIEIFLHEATGPHPVSAPEKDADQNKEIERIMDPEANPNIYNEIIDFIDTQDIATLLPESTISSLFEIAAIPQGDSQNEPSKTRSQHSAWKEHIPQTSMPNDSTLDIGLVPTTTFDYQQPGQPNGLAPTKRKAEDHSEVERAKTRREKREEEIETGTLHYNSYNDITILNEGDIMFRNPKDFTGAKEEYNRWRNIVTRDGKIHLEGNFFTKFSFYAYFSKLQKIMPDPADWKQQLRLLLCLILRSLDLYKLEPSEELPYITTNILCVRYELCRVPSDHHHVHYTEIDGYDGIFINRLDFTGLLSKHLVSDEGKRETLYEYIRGALVNLNYKKMIIFSNKTVVKQGLRSYKPLQVFFRQNGDILLYTRPLKYFTRLPSTSNYHTDLIRLLKVKICAHVLSSIGEHYEKIGLGNLIATIRTSMEEQSRDRAEAAGSSTGAQTTTPCEHPISNSVTFLLVPAFSDIKQFPMARIYGSFDSAIQHLYGDNLRKNQWLKMMSKDVFEKTYKIEITLKTEKEVLGVDSTKRD